MLFCAVLPSRLAELENERAEASRRVDVAASDVQARGKAVAELQVRGVPVVAHAMRCGLSCVVSLDKCAVAPAPLQTSLAAAQAECDALSARHATALTRRGQLLADVQGSEGDLERELATLQVCVRANRCSAPGDSMRPRARRHNSCLEPRDV